MSEHLSKLDITNIHSQQNVRNTVSTSVDIKLRDLLIDILRSNGIQVITDRTEGQRVLDKYKKSIGSNNFRLQSTFHGSSANFDHFDTSHHLYEGEGNQVFGVGTYVTAVRKVAKQYANIASLKGDRFTAVVDGVAFNYNDPKHTSDGVFLACDKLAKYGHEEAIKVLSQDVLDYVQLGWKEKEAEAREAIEFLNSHDVQVQERGRYLYTVDIPDDNGKNYLEWDGSLTSEQADTIRENLYKAVLAKNDDYKGSEKYLAQDLRVIQEGGHIGDTYGTITDYLGSGKIASDFLHDLGYVGIKVHTDHFGNDPRYSNEWNYVIFNDDDVKIEDKIKFFKAEDGDAYGFTVDNKIYVDTEIANSETPIHEYTHLWAAALRTSNRQEWDHVVDLMKSQAELWNSVKERYPQLTTDDDIADEVLATYSGQRGAERLRKQVSLLMDENDTAEASNMFKAFEEAIKRFWHDVADMLHIHYESAEQVADQVMSDMLNGLRPEAALDRRYAEAVAAGNLNEAHQMLADRAKSMGYLSTDYQGSDSWSAPVAEVEPNDFENKEALQQMVDDYGREPNIYGIINGIQAHDDVYYYHPDVAGFHGQAAEETAEILRSLRDQQANGDTLVDIYRVVPNEIVGEHIMQGDWVALSKSYCEELGKHKYGEDNYHIIETKAAIKNLWMGDEDMREFGFDDGHGDVEKNVRHNRKLLDITYDDDGHLIPLSQRFNESKEDIRFQFMKNNNKDRMKKNNGESSKDNLSEGAQKVMESFANHMVEVMQDMKRSDWKKGWSVGSNGMFGLPMNIKGFTYSGINALITSIDTFKNGYAAPVYMTYQQAAKYGCHVLEGEKSTRIINIGYHKYYNRKPISDEEYEQLSDEEKDKVYKRSYSKVYYEFNLDQTNYKEVHPENYEKLVSLFHGEAVSHDAEGMYVSPELDRMFQKQEWVCPIDYTLATAGACYWPTEDRISIPLKEQFKVSKTPEEIFKDGQEYYSTAVHEMGHSTGHKSRLNRPCLNKFGTDAYAKEELIAELTAALVCSVLGFDKRINRNSAAYLDSWVRQLSDDPNYIRTVMPQVNRASKMVLENIDKQRIALGMSPLMRSGDIDLDTIQIKDTAKAQQEEIVENPSEEPVVDASLKKDAIADGFSNDKENKWNEFAKMSDQDGNLFVKPSTADKFDIIRNFVIAYGNTKNLGEDINPNNGLLYKSHSVSRLDLSDGLLLEVSDYSQGADESVKNDRELTLLKDGNVIVKAHKEEGDADQYLSQDVIDRLWSAFVAAAPINRHNEDVVEKNTSEHQIEENNEGHGKTTVVSTGNYYNTDTDRSAVLALDLMLSDLRKGRNISDHLSDYIWTRQNVAHQIKAGSVSNIEPSMLMAYELMGNIGKGNQDHYVLVPIPGHEGKADYTLQLADRIGKITGIGVSDLLESKQHASFYNVKKYQETNGLDPEKEDFGMKIKQGMQLPEGKTPILIDNVLDTGKTISDAANALGAKDRMALVFANTDRWKEHPAYDIALAPTVRHQEDKKEGKSVVDMIVQGSRLVTADDINVEGGSQRPHLAQVAMAATYCDRIDNHLGRAWLDDEKNWMKPVRRDIYVNPSVDRTKNVGNQSQLDLENEVRILVDKYLDDDAPKELYQYDNWSDEKLLAYMKLDGGGDINKAQNVNVYEIYDYRHGDESMAAYDKYMDQYTIDNTSLSDAQKLLADLQQNKLSVWATAERAELSGQQDALNEYIKYKSLQQEQDQVQQQMEKDKNNESVAQNLVAESANDVAKNWYVQVNYLQGGDDTARFSELEGNQDYEAMLREAREYDFSDENEWDYRNTYQNNPTHFYGDTFVDEDNDYAIVVNNSVGGTYAIFRKVSEADLRDQLIEDGYGEEKLGEYEDRVSGDVKQLVNQMVEKRLQADVQPENKEQQDEELKKRQQDIDTYNDYLSSIAESSTLTPDQENYFNGLYADEIAEVEQEEADRQAAWEAYEAEKEEQLKQNNDGSNRQGEVNSGAGMDKKPEPGTDDAGNGQGEEAVPGAPAHQPTAETEHHAQRQVGDRPAHTPSGNSDADGGVPVQAQKLNEIKVRVSHFPTETSEESGAFGRLVPKMTDEELLAYMRLDGNGDPDKAYHPELYDEYDYRHGDEEQGAYDSYLQQLKESGTTKEQAEDMLANVQSDYAINGSTDKRPMLNGQQDALIDYIQELEGRENLNKPKSGNGSTAVAQQQPTQQPTEKPAQEQYKPTVKLTRAGDFYEAHGDGADIAGKVLGITVTKRNVGGAKMAGFPKHALDTYLPKLIKEGYPVDIIDGGKVVEHVTPKGSIGATSTPEQMDAERQAVNTEPTDGQKEAGNYKKGHVKVDGYDITIENPKGSTRSGKDANGKEWSIKMKTKENVSKEGVNPYQPLFEGTREEAKQIVEAMKSHIEDPDRIVPLDKYLMACGMDGETRIFTNEDWYKKYAKGKTDNELTALYRRAVATLNVYPEQAVIKPISDVNIQLQKTEDMNKEEETKQQEEKAAAEEEAKRTEAQKSEEAKVKAEADKASEEAALEAEKNKQEQADKQKEAERKAQKDEEKKSSVRAVHAALLLGAFAAAKDGIWLNPHGKSGAGMLEGGKMVTGYSRLMMELYGDKNDYSTNAYIYFDDAKKAGIAIRQNEKSLPIDWTRWDYENIATKEIILKEDYDKLSPDQQKDYVRHATKQIRNVYNVDQSIMPATKTEDYNKLVKDNGAQFDKIPESPTNQETLDLVEKLQNKHKGNTILLRDGDKYITYGTSAEQTALSIGLPHQYKFIDGKRVSYIEFPHRALDTVLPKMIRSGHRVAIADNLLEANYEVSSKLTKNSVKEAADLADKVSRKAGFTFERVLDDVPVSYDKDSDKLVYSGNNARQPGHETSVAIEKANAIYRGVVAATGTENRLDREARFNMLPEDNAKYEKLVQELASGVLMASHGLPAVISKENRELIPYWEREIKENPKIMAVLEKDVNNSVECIEKHMLDREVKYEDIRGNRPALLNTKDYTIASKMNSLPNAETREFVIIRTPSSGRADVILPEGATLPGMNKDRITHALKKEGFTEVNFYNAGGALGLNKDNSYFAGKTATLTKLNQWTLLPRHTVDLSEMYLNAEKKVNIERFQTIKDDQGRWAFYIKPQDEHSFSIYPAKDFLNAYFKAKNNPNEAEKKEMMSTLAHKYYAVAQDHPESKHELIVPKLPKDVDINKLKHTTITRDEKDHSKVFVQSVIDGKFHKEPITMGQYQRMWLADDMQNYKNAVAANAFASVIKVAKEQSQKQNDGVKIVDKSNVNDVVKEAQGHSEGRSDDGSSDSDQGEDAGRDESKQQSVNTKEEQQQNTRGFHL